MHCPICKKRVTCRDDSHNPNRFFPFCSDRCQLIDLGRWLKEDYQIGVEPDDESQDRRPPWRSQAIERDEDAE